VRSHAKAATAGSTQHRAVSLGLRLRGAIRSARVRLLLATVLTSALAAIAASPALATPPTTFAEGETFAGAGAEGAGELNFPEGIAVDQTSGDVYIADRNNNRVQKFDADGNFLMAWGVGVADGVTLELQTCGPEATPPTSRCFALNSSGTQVAGSMFPDAVAVDQANGDVYVTDGIKDRVTRFSPSGEFLLMFGKNVNKTPGTLTPNLCTAANLAEPGAVCGNGQVGSGPGEFFTNLDAITVDAAGNVWVGDTDRLVQFDSAGNYVSEAPIPGGGNTEGLARNSAGDFYVMSASLPGVRKYTPSGSPINTLTLSQTLDEAGQPQSLAVDGADNLYIGDLAGGNPVFMKFNPAGEQVAQFGSGQVLGTSSGPGGIAIGDSAGALYAISSKLGGGEFHYAQRFPLPGPGPLPGNERATGVLPTEATLEATLNPEGDETTYHFEYGTSTSYGQSTPTQTLPGTGFDDEAVQAHLDELIPGTTYHFRLVATNHCNDSEPAEECTVVGEDFTFTTLPAVDIQAQWATDITSNSAVLHAELDPLGVSAQWWIEYGTSESYGESTAEGILPAGFGAVAVSTPFLNLTPGTTYHYRFVARDERDGNVYVVHGEDKSFTTQVSGLGFQLADNRAWEMVSPPDKFGGLLWQGVEGHVQAAVDGSALAYLSLVSIEAEPEGTRAIEQSSVLARRDGAGGWHSKDITLPHTTPTPFALGMGFEYKLFSPNLGQALLEPRDATPHSPQASERTPYLRENTEPATYTPLVTGKEGFANVPPGTEFGGDPLNFFGSVSIAGATPDLSHVVLEAGVPLATGAANGGLYGWEAGELHELSVRPAGEGGATVAAVLGSGPASVRKAISDDGSRIFWSSGGAAAGNLSALYLRDLDREETVRLDVVQPGSSGIGAANPVFQGANAEGTVAFFTDSRQLTADANEEGRDLYRCEVTVEGEELGCELTNLTAETAGAKESAEVQGIASGMSDDATRIYFVARGVLDSAPNGHGDSAVPGGFNLYRWQEGGGIRFIATLSIEDKSDWAALGGSIDSMAASLSAAASPGGRYLAFMSQRSLTGHDNRDAKSGELLQQVFRYDAVADELICASCNPSGASPVGVHGGFGDLLFDSQRLWRDQAVAAVLPDATRTDLLGQSLHRRRAVHDNGRLFFNAVDSLVAADSNGNWDVYQYEPTGTGDCTSSSGGAAISRSAGGCVSLISSGTGEEESAFLDASVGGEDAFFFTSARLSVTDEDGEVDIYDARVDGIPATLTPNAECLGEACQPAARVPNDPTPASASFRGQGDVKPAGRRRCARGKRLVRRNGKARCVTRKQSRKSKARQSKGRRASR
jgi:DNA-binding beta-propeller fold protein YncE